MMALAEVKQKLHQGVFHCGGRLGSRLQIESSEAMQMQTKENIRRQH